MMGIQKLLISSMLMVLALISCSDAANSEGDKCGRYRRRYYGSCEPGLMCVSKGWFGPSYCKAQNTWSKEVEPEIEKEEISEPKPDDATCSDGELSCDSGATCYSKENLCDGRTQCDDGSDEENCQEDKPDPCDDNPCQNDGKCYASEWSTAGYKCYCMNGYYGRTCENKKHICDMQRDICNYPNGKCREGEGDDEYTCTCREGCEGDNCESCTNPCDSDPCQNDGYCYPYGRSPSGYKCKCQKEYHGANCELKRHICDLERYTICNYPRGKCMQGEGDDYTCVCREGCGGADCESCDTEDPCDTMNCENGGKCYNAWGSVYKCWCRKGYYGSRCESKGWRWWG